MTSERRRAIVGAKLALSAFLLWLLADTGALDFSLVSESLARPWGLITATGITMLTYWGAALRWRQLLGTQRISLRVRHATRLTFLGLFLNTFLPGGGVGGDMVRVAYALKAAPRHKAGAILSVFADRVLGLYGLMVVACVVVPFHWEAVRGRWELTVLAATAGLVVLGFPLILIAMYLGLRRSKRLRAFMGSAPGGLLPTVLHRLLESAVLFHRAPRAVARAFGLTLFISSGAIASLAIVAGGMPSSTATLADYAFAAPWAWIANVLPLTPGGLGVGEAAFDRICHWIEPLPTAAAYGTVFLLYRLVTFVAALPGLIGYVFYHDSIRTISHEPEAT